VENVNYLNLPNCYKLSNGTVEVIVTTDVGPRIIRYGFPNEENMLGQVPDSIIKTELGEWKPFGGHRLWTAPEANPRSYAPDSNPVEYQIEDENSIRLIQQAAPPTYIQKEMTVTLDAEGSGLRVHHRLTNRSLWGIDVAPWALTIMNDGGVVILPQEPYRSWDEYLLPARQMVLWHYTDLSDPRWNFTKNYITLKAESERAEPQKIGIANKQGWAAYHRQQTLFLKRAAYQEGAVYPDYGSSYEVYTAGSFIELETLAPIHHLEPEEAAEHVERWNLFRLLERDATQTTTDDVINSLITQISIKDFGSQ
jgi:hypothetical protein